MCMTPSQFGQLVGSLVVVLANSVTSDHLIQKPDDTISYIRLK